ncbi:MAG: ACT domain-containing protein [Erysipelotrichaceae bacterium]|jgi:ACT domain-containing protein|nr:ACT domain-containing protein [Erysipelotrichaceae bacterium]
MKAVISVIGKDQVGILAMVATECAKENINILDVSQTIVDGIFTMTMMVDIDRMDKSLDVFGDHITSMGKERDLIIRVMHEDIFNSMHQI